MKCLIVLSILVAVAYGGVVQNIERDVAENAFRNSLAPLVEAASRGDIVRNVVEDAVKKAISNRVDQLAPLVQGPGQNVVGDIVENDIRRGNAEKAAIDNQLKPLIF